MIFEHIKQLLEHRNSFSSFFFRQKVNRDYILNQVNKSNNLFLLCTVLAQLVAKSHRLLRVRGIPKTNSCNIEKGDFTQTNRIPSAKFIEMKKNEEDFAPMDKAESAYSKYACEGLHDL